MKNDSVLSHLRAHREHYLSGEDISKRLGVTRAAVWKEIQHLRELGYDIHAQPHLGYKLVSVPDKLFADEISEGLGTRVIARRVTSYEQIDSTNDAAARLGEDGSAEGAVIVAEFQKKGRGRLGRSWVSPKGQNLLFSVMLRPKLTPQETPRLTLMAAVSIVRTLEQLYGLRAGIKWPNDVYADGRKLAGILTEMSAEPDRVKFVVLGIGLDVNSAASELPEGAVSVRELAGRRVSRVELMRALLKRLDADYARFRAGEFDQLAEEWEELSITSGRRIEAEIRSQRVLGTAMGIDADGALWVRRDDGLQEKILAGDIRHT